jgi:NAD(P)-dependent dehydrogenase (short-subunit alcohol dehydrogenase family)
VALAGLEPELLAQVAAECGGAPWMQCDVSDRVKVDAAVAELVQRLGGLDVVMANAGVAAQLPLVGGDPSIFERTLAVNTLGVYYTLRAAGPHISHPRGYALAVSSLAAAIHPPLLGAYSASKAAVEAIGNTLREELRHTGARVGVAYFAELDTDMTHRGFGTEAAARLTRGGRLSRVAPLKVGVDAIERGIERRARRVVAPRWVGPVLPIRMLAQRVVGIAVRRDVAPALEIARREEAPFTTPEADTPARSKTSQPPRRDQVV